MRYCIATDDNRVRRLCELKYLAPYTERQKFPTALAIDMHYVYTDTATGRMFELSLPMRDTARGTRWNYEGEPRMPKYILHLYVTGQTPRSVHAVANLRRICEHHLRDSYELVLIDVLAQPDLAEAAHILATPTTVRVEPHPAYRVIGDLSDPGRVMLALGLDTADTGFASGKELA